MAQLDIVRGQSKAITLEYQLSGVAQDTSSYTAQLKIRQPGEDDLLLDLADARFTQTSTTVKTITLTHAETLALPLGPVEYQFEMTSGANYLLHKIAIATVYPTMHTT